MTQSKTSRSSRWHVIKIVLVGVLCCVVATTAYVSWQTLSLYKALKKQNISKAGNIAQTLVPISNIVAPPAFGDSYFLAPVRLVPELISTGSELAAELPSLAAQQTTGTIDFSPIQPKIQLLSEKLSALSEHSALEDLRPGSVAQMQSGALALQALTELLATDGHALIMLQNSDELRATGGFMGSYILLTLEDGVLVSWVVEDIYDADGQFSGYVEAPPGAREYLSSNNGLRLPDANWHPDFPTSAQHILEFFALGNRSNIKTVGAVTLSLAEDILKVLGPVHLPDYAQSITAQNVSEVLRGDRGEFFAGSGRKKHQLEQLLVQVQLKTSQLSTSQYAELARLLLLAVETKNIQLYSVQPELQNKLSKLGISGEMLTGPTSNPVFLIESNVGINKANRAVKRDIAIHHQGNQMNISITFTNDNDPPPPGSEQLNQANHNGYINFQRLFVLPDWEIASIQVGNTLVQPETIREVTTSSGVTLLEYGNLLRIPEKSSETILYTLTTKSSELAAFPIQFQPQAGIAAPDMTVDISAP